MTVDNQRIIRALKKIPLWSGLTDNELKAVYQRCKPVQSGEDEVIFKEGTASHDLFILLSGKVDIITLKKGVIHTIDVNETFGEIGLITQNTRSATALSTEKSNMLKMNHLEFNTLLGTHPRISAIMMKNITSALSQHIIRMNQSELEYLPSDKLTRDLQKSTSLLLNPDTSFKY